MTDARLRVAVIGVGHLGRHHARILSQLPGVDLVGVVDANRQRADETAAGVGTQSFSDVSAVIDRVDAVSIAVPTEAHAGVAMPFLDRAIPVLIEKPLARTVAEADTILRAASRSGARVAVGHTERYNPAVAAAKPIITRPRFIEVHRLGVFPDRSLDIDVVFDLMIHDLDIVASLVGSEVTHIDAVGIPVLTHNVDIANVRLRFRSGCIANVTASRISRDRVRKIRLFQPETYVSIDYGLQELEVWRLVRTPNQRPSIEGGRIDVTRDEPLKRELEDFVRSVRTGTPPEVTGEDGRRAVALAEQITASMAAGVV
ncbi:MAG: Gfo/Idh/MocA family oxidoreductase [Acidobacteria bacterium]|nr:Gfo/Idh/MocA family oxidoreductase [Acidobacteriota bacterium]